MRITRCGFSVTVHERILDTLFILSSAFSHPYLSPSLTLYSYHSRPTFAPYYPRYRPYLADASSLPSSLCFSSTTDLPPVFARSLQALTSDAGSLSFPCLRDGPSPRPGDTQPTPRHVPKAVWPSYMPQSPSTRAAFLLPGNSQTLAARLRHHTLTSNARHQLRWLRLLPIRTDTLL